jgi:hypothetical protein
MLAYWVLAGLILNPENGSDTFLQNVGSYTEYKPQKMVNFKCIFVGTRYNHHLNCTVSLPLINYFCELGALKAMPLSI